MLIQSSNFPAFVLTVDLAGLELLARLSNETGDYYFVQIDYAPDPENMWIVLVEPRTKAALADLDDLLDDPVAYLKKKSPPAA